MSMIILFKMCVQNILAIYGVSDDDVSDVFFAFYAYLGLAVEFLASCWVQINNKTISVYVSYVRIMSASLSIFGLSQEDIVLKLIRTLDDFLSWRCKCGFGTVRCILFTHHNDRRTQCVLLRHSHASKDPQARYRQRRIASSTLFCGFACQFSISQSLTLVDIYLWLWI